MLSLPVGRGTEAWRGHVACFSLAHSGRRVGFKNAQPFSSLQRVNKHLLSNHKSSNKLAPRKKNKKTKKQLGFFPQKMPGNWEPWRWPRCVQGGGDQCVCFVFLFLRVDGDDLATTAADQEDPVEALEKNLQELHV